MPNITELAYEIIRNNTIPGYYKFRRGFLFNNGSMVKTAILSQNLEDDSQCEI